MLDRYIKQIDGVLLADAGTCADGEADAIYREVAVLCIEKQNCVAGGMTAPG